MIVIMTAEATDADIHAVVAEREGIEAFVSRGPESAWCDGAQALEPGEAAELGERVRESTVWFGRRSARQLREQEQSTGGGSASFH